jgi:uncharacterized protein (DUF2252 family)
MLFDVNDFDETYPGPWEWDVKRLAASFEIGGRDRGFDPADRRAIVLAGVHAHRDQMRRVALMGTLEAWYDHLAVDELLGRPLEDLIVPRSEWENAEVLIKSLLQSHRRTLTHEHHPIEEFRYVHTARKVVGVGSVGTRCYIMLLVGRDNGDPLFLQVKEAQGRCSSRTCAG